MNSKIFKMTFKPELEKPGMNTFVDMLSEHFAQDKSATPVQMFHDHFRKMEKCARAGDIPGWRGLHQELSDLAAVVQVDLEEDLDIMVRIHQIELTLLLKAGHRALREAKLNEKEATQAQIAEEHEKGQTLMAKAQKLQRLGTQLHNQLLAKTA